MSVRGWWGVWWSLRQFKAVFVTCENGTLAGIELWRFGWWWKVTSHYIIWPNLTKGMCVWVSLWKTAKNGKSGEDVMKGVGEGDRGSMTTTEGRWGKKRTDLTGFEEVGVLWHKRMKTEDVRKTGRRGANTARVVQRGSSTVRESMAATRGKIRQIWVSSGDFSGFSRPGDLDLTQRETVTWVVGWARHSWCDGHDIGGVVGTTSVL